MDISRFSVVKHPVREVKQQDGSIHYLRELDYETRNEGWQLYELKDGGTVRIKTPLLKLFEVLHPDPNRPGEFVAETTAQGDRSIYVFAAPLLAVWSE